MRSEWNPLPLQAHLPLGAPNSAVPCLSMVGSLLSCDAIHKGNNLKGEWSAQAHGSLRFQTMVTLGDVTGHRAAAELMAAKKPREEGAISYCSLQ